MNDRRPGARSSIDEVRSQRGSLPSPLHAIDHVIQIRIQDLRASLSRPPDPRSVSEVVDSTEGPAP